MPPEFNTLEEARAEILRLNEELNTAQTERDNYSNRITALENENQSVRELNQQYFLKLSQQFQKPDEQNPDEDSEPLSCEDFAKTLKL